MNFDHILLRLKQVLGVTTDKEVAQALAMSKTALAERKRRDAFPVEKLMILAAKNEAVDTAYVLTGRRAADDAAAAAQIDAAFLGVQQDAAKYMIARAEHLGLSNAINNESLLLNAREIALVFGFRDVTDDDKIVIESMIAALLTKRGD